MKDFDEFDKSLQLEGSYLTSLSRSMSLVLEEFYQHIKCVGVSSFTLKGFDQTLLDLFETGRKEYEEIYLPEINQKLAAPS